MNRIAHARYKGQILHEKGVCDDNDDNHVTFMPRCSTLTACILLVTVSVLCFCNSYDGAFVFDDSEAIINNKDLKPETPWTDLLEHDFWGSTLASNSSHKSYRPLTVLTFRWNYWLAGGEHPQSFHIINIMLHGVVSVIFLFVFRVILCDGSRLTSDPCPTEPLLCALLFTVHPVHTECVAGIVGRADLLCALCFLLSFLAYTRSCNTGSLPWLGTSMIICAVSVLCKEQGITVLGLCSAYDIIICNRLDLRKIFSNGIPPAGNKVSMINVRSLICRHVVLAVAGCVILLVRWRLMGSSPPTFQVVDNPQSFVNSTILRVLNYNYLYSLNVWLLIAPCWLCFDWSMGCVPVIDTFTDVRLVGVIAFWAVLGLLLAKCLLMPSSKEQRVLTLGLAFLIVPFLPATNVFFRVGFVVAERILYLPSAGFIIILVLGIQMLSRHYCKYQNVLSTFYLAILLLYTTRAIQRSSQWRNEEELFNSGAVVCPLNAKVHYNIAKIHSDRGRPDLAIAKYNEAITLHPEYDQALNNLANVLKDQGKPEPALVLLQRAVKIRPTFAAAWMNLGIVQATLNQSSAAEQSYRTALKHRRKYPDCYYNLGNLYLELKRHAEALSAWRNATLMKPTHTNAWSNMLMHLDSLERYQDIDIIMKEAFRFNPSEAILHYHYANSLGKAGRTKDSESHFLRAIKLSPNVASFHANLAVLYHRMGKHKQAQSSYLQALHLDPASQVTHQNYQMLLKTMGRDLGKDNTAAKHGQ